MKTRKKKKTEKPRGVGSITIIKVPVFLQFRELEKKKNGSRPPAVFVFTRFFCMMIIVYAGVVEAGERI